MLDELRELQAALNRVKSSLPRPLTKQVQGKGVREDLKTIVDNFFRTVRPALVKCGVKDAELSNIDDQMQELLESCHKKLIGGKYAAEIKKVQASTVVLEGICLTRTSRPPSGVANTTDEAVIETLQALLPSAAYSYEQAIIDIQGGNRLSWRGPATDLRESLRETLDHLAPDKDVEKQPNYKAEKDAKGPTMKQKVRYVLSKRGSGSAAAATTESAVSAIEDMLSSFVRSIYTRSSVSTHTPTDKTEVIRVRDLVRVALCELLEIPT